MTGDPRAPIYIDSDNALGSEGGDVDDGFAIAALFASGVSIAGLGSVFGNTTEPLANANHKALASLCGYEGPILRGADAACPAALRTMPARRDRAGRNEAPLGAPRGFTAESIVNSRTGQPTGPGIGTCADSHAGSHNATHTCGQKGPGAGSHNFTHTRVHKGPGAGIDVADVTERVQGETEASRFLINAREPLRILALGPLTNLAAALDGGLDARSRWTEVIVVGGSVSSPGRWPPLWPFEFNLTKDRRAATRVFASNARLTLVPLDVARGLRVSAADLSVLPGALGAHLRSGAARWLRRTARLKLSRSFPVWDLVAALYALDARLFETGSMAARFHSNGWLELGAGGVEIQCVRGFDRDALWRCFVDLVSGVAANSAR